MPILFSAPITLHYKSLKIKRKDFYYKDYNPS